jgi:GntR family transcriptional regulator
VASVPPTQRIRLPAAPAPRISIRPLDQGVARYYRLYELLLAALQEGTIAPGSALPSEPELCARHGISRTTVRRALDRLEREGRIVRRRGSGTYARARPPVPPFCLELHTLPGTLAAWGSGTTVTTLRFDPAPVPPGLAAIAAGIGSTAYRLEQLWRGDGEPVSLTSAYLPEPVRRRLRRRIARGAAVMTMLERLGPPTAAVRYSIAAVAADADAARALGVPLGSPVLRVRAVLLDGARRLRAVLESLCRSERLRLKVLEPPPQTSCASHARASRVSKASTGNGRLCR